MSTGLVHDAALPVDQRASPEAGLSDIVQLGFATSGGSVVQVCFDRRHQMFEEREIALLAMVEPAIRRLVRGCEEPATVRSLTRSERDVLALAGARARRAGRL